VIKINKIHVELGQALTQVVPDKKAFVRDDVHWLALIPVHCKQDESHAVHLLLLVATF